MCEVLGGKCLDSLTLKDSSYFMTLTANFKPTTNLKSILPLLLGMQESEKS